MTSEHFKTISEPNSWLKCVPEMTQFIFFFQIYSNNPSVNTLGPSEKASFGTYGEATSKIWPEFEGSSENSSKSPK